MEEKAKLGDYFIGSIDQGTTSTRFLIFNGLGQPVAQHQIEFEQICPQPGWIDHNPDEIYKTVEDCIEQAVQSFVDLGYAVSDIKAVGLTTQRETTVLWDTNTGKPICNAIAWPDTRTGDIVQEFKRKEGADKIQGICGLYLSTYHSSAKLEWLRRNNKDVQEAYQAGRLAFGTVNTWLLYKLNGGMKRNLFVTDVTNASRTMYLNLHTLEYDPFLLDFFNLDTSKVKMPTVRSCSDANAFGSIASGPLAGIGITGCIGDQSAALVGQLGFSPGRAKNTYGTGCFLLYNVGEHPVISEHGLLATVAYDFGHPFKPVYALEGSIAAAGSAVKFLQNNLNFIAASSEINELAETVPDNGGCYFVTAFSGLLAPYWIDDARGSIFGLTQYTKKGHLARATLEASCFQTRAILAAMEKDSGHSLTQLAVDGGMSNSDLCMQTQADIIGIPVDRPHMRETTALGAAIVAGLAVDVWKELEELKEINKEDRTLFSPELDKDQRDKMYHQWQRAVEMSKGWLGDGEGKGPH